jgi:hypothetical protein
MICCSSCNPVNRAQVDMSAGRLFPSLRQALEHTFHKRFFPVGDRMSLLYQVAVQSANAAFLELAPGAVSEARVSQQCSTHIKNDRPYHGFLPAASMI